MFLTIVAFFFVLSIVVIVHELGHFAAAKLNGIYVVTFSVGFGPKVLKKRIGETEYALSLLPFGGYVKFAGEDEKKPASPDGAEAEQARKEIPEHRLFRNKNPFQRIAVVLAGPFMNAFAALAVFILSIMIQGVFVSNPSSIVTGVALDSPAETAGFMPGDRILSINGRELESGTEISDLIVYEEDAVSTFLVERVGDTFAIEVSPVWSEEQERFMIGLYSSTPPMIGDVKRDGPAHEAGMRSGALVLAVNDTTVATFHELQSLIHGRIGMPLLVTWIQAGDTLSALITPQPVDAAAEGERLEVIKVGAIGINEFYARHKVSLHEASVYGTRAFVGLLRSILDFLGKLVSGRASLRAVGGPVRVGVMAGDMIRWGFNYLISFLAFFSLNLAIFNLLPILPFDGGHFVIFLVEGVTGYKPGERAQAAMAQFGFILLIALMAFIFIVDMFNLFG